MLVTAHIGLVQYAINVKLHGTFCARRIFAKLVAQILQEVGIVAGAASGRGRGRSINIRTRCRACGLRGDDGIARRCRRRRRRRRCCLRQAADNELILLM